MNEIKVNNPLKIKIYPAHDQYYYFIYKGKKFYGEEYVDEDTGEITFVIAKADNRYYNLLDIGSVGKKGDYTIRGQAAREFNKNEYIKVDNINEIKRLQQLAGIQEIKINNPVITPESVYKLYIKKWNEGIRGPSKSLVTKYVEKNRTNPHLTIPDSLPFLPKDELTQLYNELIKL